MIHCHYLHSFNGDTLSYVHEELCTVDDVEMYSLDLGYYGLMAVLWI